MVALNAGAAIYVAGRAGSLAEGVDTAGKVLNAGTGGERLERYAERTQSL
jgi:anthranilate phosphoribosyltransferase